MLPTAQELQELIELKSESNWMHQQAAIGQPAASAVDSASADHAPATATASPETQP